MMLTNMDERESLYCTMEHYKGKRKKNQMQLLYFETRSQPKRPFLLGKPRGGGFSPWISLKNGDGSSLTAVFCAGVKRKM